MRERSLSLDALRGLVMVLMALDHTRDFTLGYRPNPTDLEVTTWALFFTRWITHFCAPVFILTTGVAAYLSGKRRSTAALRRWLASRGLWLIFLEVTVVRAAWMLDVNYHRVVFQVIWAIGWSMLALSLLIALSVRAIAIFGGAMVLLHNLLDDLHAEAFGSAGWLWKLLHEHSSLNPTEHIKIFVAYPLIPWIGVMALGYALGRFIDAPSDVRRRRLLTLGAALTTSFVILRALNGYGDPHPFTHPPREGFVILSFLNCEKYPPSLDYLLMTLGPALLLFGALERRQGVGARMLATVGRVPLFYYVAHLLVIHLWVLVLERGAPGFSLPWVYAVWVVSVLTLYPLSRWYGEWKARRTQWWVSYL